MTQPTRDDPQQHNVYSWERDFILSLMPPMFLSTEEVKELIYRAAHVSQCPRPTVEFCSLEIACLAYPMMNHIRIADWGRNPIVVLHEMAHIASWPAVRDGQSGHGPAFVGQAINLYSRFSPLTVDYLQDTARRRKLTFDVAKPRISLY